MTGVSVGVVGATGLVGEEMLRVLEERRFPVSELRAFAWQAGYGAFAVSFSNIPAVRAYLSDQENHHRPDH